MSATTPSYPSKEHVRAVMQLLEDGSYDEFFSNVLEDVDWMVMGHHPLAGQYTSRDEFRAKTLARLGKLMKSPLQLKVLNIIGGGAEEEWTAVELYAEGVCLNGLRFDNTYNWAMRWNREGKAVQVRAYLDSALVKQAIEENE